MGEFDGKKKFFSVGPAKKDGISVVLRARPLSENEREFGERDMLTFPGNGEVQVQTTSGERSYTFNTVFEPGASQSDVFNNCGIKDLVELSKNGYSCVCFVYGQTGSGKTYTMTGPPAEYLFREKPDPNLFGILPRSFCYLFDLLKDSKSTNHRIFASYFEIYNEQIYDLLNNHSMYHLNVRWKKRRGFYVDNLFVVEVNNVEELMAVVETGMKNRAFNATYPNEFSSRSHCLLSIMIDSDVTDTTDEALIYTKHGKLTFVDLAGSEKMKPSHEVSQEQMNEAMSINRSLLVLGNCISSLCDPRRRGTHIPYRDSKLTKLLSDSLGGHGITLMLACISPSASNIPETSNTLRYAMRALRMDNKPVIKIDPREEYIKNLRRELKHLKEANLYLRSRTENVCHATGRNSERLHRPKPTLARNGLFGDKPHDSTKSRTQSLYEMLQDYMLENEELRRENSELTQFKLKQIQENEMLTADNIRLAQSLEKVKSEMTPTRDCRSVQCGSQEEVRSLGVQTKSRSDYIEDSRKSAQEQLSKHHIGLDAFALLNMKLKHDLFQLDHEDEKLKDLKAKEPKSSKLRSEKAV